MTEYKKERGVPLPPAARRSSKGYTQAVLSLQPDESVWLPVGRKTAYDVVHRLSYDRGLIELDDYAIRPETRDGAEGTRVWRLKKGA